MNRKKPHSHDAQLYHYNIHVHIALQLGNEIKIRA